MPDLVHWSTFFTATIILLLIPGPSVMYVVTRGIEHGYRGVFLSSLGLALGDLLQVLCTVAGLSALLASSVFLFGIVKYVGATYLIVLGIRRLLEKNAPSPTSTFVVLGFLTNSVYGFLGGTLNSFVGVVARFQVLGYYPRVIAPIGGTT